jgi:hypothetical protein
MAILPVKKGISSAAVTSIPDQWSKQWFQYFIDAFLTNADIRNVSTGSGIVVSGNVSGNSTVGAASPTVTITQAPITNNTVMGNVSGVTAVPTPISQAQLTALINIFTSSLPGLVPASGGIAATFLSAAGSFVVPPLFTATTPGYVPLSGGGTVNFLRADGTFAAPSVTISPANPTALVGLTVINGTATTYMRSDAAPALNQSITPTWLGNHAFAAGFQTRGILDSSSSSVLTLNLNSVGAVTILAPSSGTTLTVDGNATSVAQIISSGLAGSTQGSDLSIRRAGSTINTVAAGPTLDLTDTSATTETALQHSGGQTELWQFNSGAWAQILKVTTAKVFSVVASGGVSITPGAAGTAPITLVNPGGSTNAIVAGSQYANTGTAVPTLSSNKPGSNSGVINWLQVNIGSINGFIPVFG